MPQPSFVPLPESSLVSDALRIRLHGCRSGERWTIRLVASRSGETAMVSAATFIAAGTDIDLSADAPVEGSYRGADSMGLFWSQVRVDLSTLHPAPTLDPEPGVATLDAISEDGTVVATCSFRRGFHDASVRVRDVRADGLVGTFFSPGRTGSRPAIMVLGGSSGGLTWCEEIAGLLASQGYCALALAYFGLEHLPSHLERIPLEYFGVGLRWLAEQPQVDARRIGLCGHSRGAELTLLLASKYAQVRAVVAYAPSGIVWPAPPPARGAAWTWEGKDVPYAEVMSYEAWDQAVAAGLAQADSLDWYLIPLREAGYREAASIRVEDICGSVLMVSGQDDGIWPSTALADLALQRCTDAHFKHSIEHVSYEGLGHLMGWPYWPSAASRRHPISGEVQHFGGEPSAAARARLDSWEKTLQFLEKRL